MNEEDLLKKIERFADAAHGAQTRKYTNDRYIVHPIRVMNLCEHYNNDIAVLAAALLHDVLEDTAVTRDELFTFLKMQMDTKTANSTIKLVEELTDIYTKNNFPSLNRKVRKALEAQRLSLVSSDAQTIKYADIIDNSDLVTADPDFATVYLREASILLEIMQKGNNDLRDKAIQRITECKRILKRIKFSQ
ncbi:HD domain-containing protein [Chryseosolibacter indicus]|uniref:HD domain-containing protein n=1 Tax=Chryseosolibacter indicus TaxID=2782351 RepID=A0ABS5VW23_9BACT|nr:HD domain-containing protein [Chryseosolibacter indicus]MBT1705022.1 HD domain-containing protein [Chryseosolibacter indicus]